jgi:mRNA interferase RelE/StbE
MEVVFTRAANRALTRRIPGPDAKRIVARIEALATDPRGPRHDVKRLQGRPESRLRVGDWRVIFVVEGDTLIVTEIGHRREIYR